MSLELEDLTEEWEEDLTPKTEREPHTPRQRQWSKRGFVITHDVLSEEVMCAYEDEWREHNADSPGGWPHATPYMHHAALRRVVCDGTLAGILEELVGEPMGVHLNLTGWRSTRRNWHRDQYLNEPYVGGFYAAVWIALDDIHPDAGPFEYVPGSHTGEPLSQMKVRRALGDDGIGPDWPTHSERILTPLFVREMQRKQVKVQQFLGTRGEILIWHGRLLHRGSPPIDETLERRGLIAHFSGVHHRPDMPAAVQHEAGGWYFPLGGTQPLGLR